MKVVLQRVNSANVKIDNTIISEIQTGVVLLWGIKKGDTVRDADVLIKKIVNLRIFVDLKTIRIMGRIQICGFLRIFIVAFLVFIAPAGSANPAGHLLTLE